MKKELAIDCYVGYSNEFMVSLVKEATEKSLICKLEAKYIDNIYFKSFEKFKKKIRYYSIQSSKRYNIE